MPLNYIAQIINSVFRSTSPILLVALGSAICGKVGVFNVALEGQMLIGCFVSIVVNYFTSNVLLSVLAGILSGGLIALIVAVLQVKYKGPDMVIGTSINILVAAMTSYLLFIVFGLRGKLADKRIIPLGKLNIDALKDTFIGRMFADLTIIDYACYFIAILIFIYLYKTVQGYRVLSVGLNKTAAESLGTKGTKIQMLAVIASGLLCGLGGVVLSMGQVTLFTENMSAGRGFIAMAAASMGMNHPIITIFSSLFFGICQALGTALQGSIKSQITMAIPYIGTVVALVIFSKRLQKNK
ncbi:ABC transporter permease [Peptoniphilaceae bacterium SGI.131]